MRFIDEAIISVQAGKGGAGSRHFRREKFIPLGGPDGGNGGKGGSVILRADRNSHTLLDFKFRPLWKAEDGLGGDGARKDGRAGEDLIILVPVGTQVLIANTDTVIADLDEDAKEFVLAKGGRGGKGNTFFKSATNQAPEYAQPGEVGEEGEYMLSLKLVADVGLIGFPNAGKSTLISRISAAKPKIADYPFTTLSPNLGVAAAKGGRAFVVADIPGLIPGAHLGKGLGIQFLKHVERTRILAHLIDPNQVSEDGTPIPPLESFDLINKELSAFSDVLATKQQLVVLSKADTITEPNIIEDAKAAFESAGHRCLVISSATGQGIPELVEVLASVSGEARKAEPTPSPIWDD